MKSSRRLALIAGLAACAPLWTVHSGAAEPGEYREVLLEAWQAVRLTEQRLAVDLGARKAKLNGRFTLKAQRAAAKTVFGFPLAPGQEACRVSCDGIALKAIPYVRQAKTGPATRKPHAGDIKAWERHRKAERKKQAARHRGSTVKNELSRLMARSSYQRHRQAWQAHEIALTAGQTRTVQVSTTILPYQLADHARHGPCYAFRFPIRLGRIWARPAGKLEVTVTLGEDVDPGDVILTRPPGVKRAGRKITLKLDGRIPTEDLIVVLKGKLPEKKPRPAKEPPRPKRAGNSGPQKKTGKEPEAF